MKKAYDRTMREHADAFEQSKNHLDEYISDQGMTQETVVASAILTAASFIGGALSEIHDVLYAISRNMR